MKKLIVLILCTLVMCSSVGIAAVADSTPTPYYNNVARTTTTCDIVDNSAIIELSYVGYSGVTELVEINTILFKLNGTDWVEVISWNEESTRARDSFSYSYDVTSGTYKVTVEYQFYGSGGATDVINYEEQITN